MSENRGSRIEDGVKKPRGKQHDVRAASLTRLAKALRVRVRNYARLAREAQAEGKTLNYDFFNFRSGILKEFAEEFDHEAATLRAMR